jgi:hypothetical protein
MSVKSTVRLSREDAEKKFIEIRKKQIDRFATEALERDLKRMDNAYLERMLESLDAEESEGFGKENYIIE